MTEKHKVYLFDFGNVFLNLDTNATRNELIKLGFTEFTDEMMVQNHLYEKGQITTNDFLKFYKTQFTETSETELKTAWNKILLDFPLYRLEFIETFSKQNTCMLLSNINDMHLEYIKTNLGEAFYNRFIGCFDKIYYSHLIHMRKPDAKIYNHVLTDNNLVANEVFFIDDMAENTKIAAALGFKVWNINPLKEDVINLRQQIKNQ